MNKTLLILVIALALACGILGYLWGSAHQSNTALQDKMKQLEAKADIERRSADESLEERDNWIVKANEQAGIIERLEEQLNSKTQHHAEERAYVDTAGRDALRERILRPMP